MVAVTVIGIRQALCLNAELRTTSTYIYVKVRIMLVSQRGIAYDSRTFNHSGIA